MLSDNKLTALCESIDVPVDWWNEPQGWLLKPNFKRRQQRRSQAHRSFKSFGFKAYHWRWWSLSGNVLSYNKDQNARRSSGSIDLSTAISVSVSVVADAPSNAIDIVTAGRVYTIAADTRIDMLRWAKVLKAIIAGNYAACKNGDFNVNFEKKEPLLMRLMPLADASEGKGIVVTGFVKKRDGSMGQAEASGLIEEGDLLVGINGINLEDKTFAGAIADIRSAVWPITLEFHRTKSSSTTTSNTDMSNDTSDGEGSFHLSSYDSSTSDKICDNHGAFLSRSMTSAVARGSCSRRQASEPYLRIGRCSRQASESHMQDMRLEQPLGIKLKRHSMICITARSATADVKESVTLPRPRPRSASTANQLQPPSLVQWAFAPTSTGKQRAERFRAP
jgi:hypothetical protein